MGNFRGDEPMRSHEERGHFGLWSIVSSPLILGFNLSNEEDMDRVWPTITNADALQVGTLGPVPLPNVHLIDFHNHSNLGRPTYAGE